MSDCARCQTLRPYVPMDAPFRNQVAVAVVPDRAMQIAVETKAASASREHYISKKAGVSTARFIRS